MKLYRSKTIMGILLIALVLCALIIPAVPVFANPDTSMSISPSSQTVNAGDTFSVDVTLNTTGQTRGAQFSMNFDPALVEVNTITEGTFYSDWATSNPPAFTYFQPGTINNTAGTVSMYAVGILNGSGGPTGSGTFIVINMTAKASVSGTSVLDLIDTFVWDETGTAVADLIVNDGDVIVGSGSTNPPTVATNAADTIDDDSAMLHGNLSGLGDASSVDVSFEWGYNTSYGNETTAQTMTSTGAFSFEITGLVPGTTYHFRAKAAGDGNGYGTDMDFATTGTAPSGTNLTATILPAVAISVNPTSIDFGELVAGDVSSGHNINIENIGGKTIDVTADVTGDALYVDSDGLYLDAAIWSFYLTDALPKHQTTTTEATLHVASDYTGLGVKDGVLIFFAELDV
jgi:trimeric autotransporter adhesin